MLSYEERKKEWEEDKNYLFFALHLIFIIWCFNSFYSLVFIIPWALYLYLFKIKFEIVLWAIFGSILLLSLQNLKCPNTYFNYLFDFHAPLDSFLKSHYSQRDASFIGLLLFNKGKKDSEIYANFKDLGLTHLISISGLHFDLIKKFLYYLFFKNKKILNCATPLILITWWCFTNFSIPCLRVILTTFLKTKSRLKTWSISTIFAPFFNFGIYTNHSFLLSFFISLIILLVDGKNKIQKRFILIFIYSSLITLPRSQKLHLLSFINFIIFSPIIVFLFIYFFLTFPLFFLSSLSNKIISLFYFLLIHSHLNKSYFIINWSYEASAIFLLIFTTLLVINLAIKKR